MKILVTGAAGFIGSALCHKLVDFGHDLLAIDNFSTYYDVSLKRARVNELLKPLKIDVLGTMSDSTYIQCLIDSKPRTKLETGIKKTILRAKRTNIAFHLNKWVGNKVL